jgi:hypothetical protein
MPNLEENKLIAKIPPRDWVKKVAKAAGCSENWASLAVRGCVNGRKAKLAVIEFNKMMGYDK